MRNENTFKAHLSRLHKDSKFKIFQILSVQITNLQRNIFEALFPVTTTHQENQSSGSLIQTSDQPISDTESVASEVCTFCCRF